MNRQSEILGRQPSPKLEQGVQSKSVDFIRIDTLRGRIPADPIHQVPDHELELLASGSPESPTLNLAIGLVSLAVGLLVSLLTTTSSHRLVISILTAIFLGSGITLGIVWLVRRRSTRDLVEKIRARLD